MNSAIHLPAADGEDAKTKYLAIAKFKRQAAIEKIFLASCVELCTSDGDKTKLRGLKLGTGLSDASVLIASFMAHFLARPAGGAACLNYLAKDGVKKLIEGLEKFARARVSFHSSENQTDLDKLADELKGEIVTLTLFVIDGLVAAGNEANEAAHQKIPAQYKDWITQKNVKKCKDVILKAAHVKDVNTVLKAPKAGKDMLRAVINQLSEIQEVPQDTTNKIAKFETALSEALAYSGCIKGCNFIINEWTGKAPPAKRDDVTKLEETLKSNQIELPRVMLSWLKSASDLA